MRKILYILFFVTLPVWASAQVEKSVEVTKDYVPSVAGASKLPIKPDMTDTTALRPEIGYSITPSAMATTINTRTIRPATMTYWEFNRPKPFYLKLGGGVPGNSVADLYITTQNPGTGYLTGYINHEGRYAKSGDAIISPIQTQMGVANAARMYNRAGVAAGKYFGRRILEGEVSYDNRYYHRFSEVSSDWQRPRTDYGEFGVAIRLGDDFKDLSRTNFNIGLRGELFDADSDLGSTHTLRSRQTHLGVDFALARQFKKNLFRVQAMYEHGDGTRSIEGYGQDMVMAGLRYGYVGQKFDFELGADYWYDRIAGKDATHYVLPALRMRFNASRGFAPYIEIDGSLHDNSLRTLCRENPYVTPEMWGEGYSRYLVDNRLWDGRSTLDYNFRLGFSGGAAGGKLAYRIFAGYSISENHTSWTIVEDNLYMPLFFLPVSRQLNMGSLNGEVEYKPIDRLLFTANLRGYFYEDDTALKQGLPRFRGEITGRYTAKKVSFGVRMTMLGEREWSYVDLTRMVPTTRTAPFDLSLSKSSYTVPFTVDLCADVDWRVAKSLSIFAEVRNIAGAKLYELPYYREYGINFTAGIKMSF